MHSATSKRESKSFFMHVAFLVGEAKFKAMGDLHSTMLPWNPIDILGEFWWWRMRNYQPGSTLVVKLMENNMSFWFAVRPYILKNQKHSNCKRLYKAWWMPHKRSCQLTQLTPQIVAALPGW